MHDSWKLLAGKEPSNALGIGEVEFLEPKGRLLLKPCEARLLECHIVILVEVVEADDLMAARQQPQRRVIADEAGGSGQQDLHERLSTSRTASRIFIAGHPPPRRGIRA